MQGLVGIASLGRFREITGSSLREIAEATGLTEGGVSRICSGDIRDPRLSTAQAIQRWADGKARALRLPKDQWLHIL